tara:strand:+ start:1903 stop:2475 length:573 start_codon:yes stop_codon:yes gene_type:complete
MVSEHEHKLIVKLAKHIQNQKIEITEDFVLEKLKDNRRWPWKYSEGQDTVGLISNFYPEIMYKPFFKNGYLDYNEWKKFYDLGYTSIISNVFSTHEQLRELHEYLLNNTGIVCSGNFYISKGGGEQRPSFEGHIHEYSVIVKQIYGNGYWLVEGNEIILTPQHTLKIPAGAKHQLLEVKEPKLSLTINLL